MVFAMIHSFFVMVMFCLCSENRIHQSIQHALSRRHLAGPDNTIISYYSHKNSYFGKTFLQKMAGYTERTISLKLCDRVFDQSTNLFSINVQKKSSG